MIIVEAFYLCKNALKCVWSGLVIFLFPCILLTNKCDEDEGGLVSKLVICSKNWRKNRPETYKKNKRINWTWQTEDEKDEEQNRYHDEEGNGLRRKGEWWEEDKDGGKEILRRKENEKDNNNNSSSIEMVMKNENTRGKCDKMNIM